MNKKDKLALSKAEGLIPQLRFPEFKNEGEWDSTPLDDLCELITKGTTPTTLGYSYTESGVNFIKIESILEGNINLQRAAFISNECNEALKRSQLNENDILFSIAGALGVVTTVNKEILPANTNQALSIVRLKNKKQKDYVKAFLKSNIVTTEIEKIKAGAAQPNISLSQVANFKILIPKSLQEQQKIASCLSSLDDLIAAHSQKLDLLKDHKKGLMQNLFPQEGEKVPKLRFKEFEKDGEWVEKKMDYFLDLLTDFEANGSFADVKENVRVFDEPNFAWYVRATDLENKSNLESVKYVDEHSYNFLNKTRLFGGELLITKRGEIGKVYIYKPFKNLPATVAPNMYLLKLNEKAEASFFFYHFTNAIGNQSLKKLNASSTIGALYKDDVKNITLFTPKIKEQQKIAACLSSIDSLIKSHTEKIEQLRLHKKGLMQGLFPKINE